MEKFGHDRISLIFFLFIFCFFVFFFSLSFFHSGGKYWNMVDAVQQLVSLSRACHGLAASLACSQHHMQFLLLFYY